MSYYNFTVAHMFAYSVNGHIAGEIETPEATKTSEGLEFTVNGLSPIAISWYEIDKETNIEEDEKELGEEINSVALLKN